jgi:hypothetical protein
VSYFLPKKKYLLQATAKGNNKYEFITVLKMILKYMYCIKRRREGGDKRQIAGAAIL